MKIVLVVFFAIAMSGCRVSTAGQAAEYQFCKRNGLDVEFIHNRAGEVTLVNCVPPKASRPDKEGK